MYFVVVVVVVVAVAATVEDDEKLGGCNSNRNKLPIFVSTERKQRTDFPVFKLSGNTILLYRIC